MDEPNLTRLQVKKSEPSKIDGRMIVVTLGIKVPCARIDTSGMRVRETPHTRYRHLNKHNGAINVQKKM